jgi:CPA2 family monovalent cation:H+ antiporter-2
MTDFLLLAFIFLCAGVIAVPLATRFGLGSVLGYLIAGIVISPLLAALGVDVVSIQHFAEFGVVMMLFLVGLELEPKLLWEMRTRLFGLGGGQVLLTTAAITAVAMLLGQPWSVALAIGLVLALSSTAIVLQTLNEKGLMKSDGGQASFSVLLFQDIAVIPMLALIPLLALPELAGMAEVASGGDASGASHGGGHSDGHGDDHGNSHADINLVDGTPAWLHAATDICAILLVIFGGNYLTGPMFRFIAVAQLRELFTAAALLFVIGVALLMTVVGLSPALGTFLAGVVLANSEYRHELESDIDPFKGLLLGLFFITVGAGINFSLLFDNAVLIAALTVGLIAIKAAVLFLLATLMRIRGPGRWLMALGLAQAGEFGFVLLSFTVAKGVIPAPIADQLLLVVALSMVLTPLLFIFYDRVIVPAHAHSQEREADDMPPDSHIIVAGRGRVGGIVDRMLQAAGHTPTVIDYNAKQLEFLKRFGVRAYYGDATRPDLLHAAGIAEARLLVVALDERTQITEMVRYVTKHYPQVHVVARAVNREHVYELWAVGCRDIVRETYDSSLRIGRSAFQALGAEPETAQAMVDVFNRYDRDAMVAVADAYDIDIPTVENEEFIKRVLQYGDEKEPQLQRDVSEVMRRGATDNAGHSTVQ